MPAINVTDSLTNPTSSLTAGTKYVVQNQGYASVRMAVSTSAINAKTQDSLSLPTMTSPGRLPNSITHTRRAKSSACGPRVESRSWFFTSYSHEN